MATSIFFAGRLIRTPGSYSEIDASGLDTVGLSASGIVAVLGTGEGGVPYTEAVEKPMEQLQRFASAEKMQKTFRSGWLREVANMLFAPAKDPDIRAGAQEVVVLKVNPATQSTAALTSGSDDQIDLTSRDFGAFTSQINVELQDGTTKGKMLTIVFEDTTEAVDNLGGDTLATLQYSAGTYGYDTAEMDVDADGNILASATRLAAGKDTDLANPATNAAIEILSSNVGDTTQTVTVFGLVGGVATKLTLALNGTTVVPGTGTTWDASGVLGVEISAAHAGTVTVRTLGGAGVDIFSVATGTLTKGLVKCQTCYVNNTTVTAKLDSAGTPYVLLFGKSITGSDVSSKITEAGTVAQTSAESYGTLEYVVTGGVAAARTVTITVANAAKSLGATQTTLQKAADYFNTKSQVISSVTRGFIFTIGTGKTKFLVDNLDIQSDVDIRNVTTGILTGDLYAIVAWINQNSQLISAEVSDGATTLPDNTTSPLFLTGGVEGVASFSDYQAALNVLKRVRVNSVVDLSGDPAVAAAVDAHCAYMGGIGRSERDGFVGLLNDDMDDVPTKTQALAQVVDINSRHIRAFGQAITRFNTDGEKTEFLPPFLGAIAAGAQAGSPVGTSLTFKFMDVLGFRQHSTWNPTDDSEEMIEGGLCFLEDIPSKGRRFVRNITTHLSSNNLAFIEGSVNNAVNFAIFNFRTAMEFAVGKQGFAGTLAAGRGVATGILGLLVDENTLTQYRALQLQLQADVLDVSVEVAPVIPINFVTTTMHLRTLSLAA